VEPVPEVACGLFVRFPLKVNAPEGFDRWKLLPRLTRCSTPALNVWLPWMRVAMSKICQAVAPRTPAVPVLNAGVPLLKFGITSPGTMAGRPSCCGIPLPKLRTWNGKLERVTPRRNSLNSVGEKVWVSDAR
jgi:hypothetical protein